jgi:cell wall assembly regulator SMI1
VDNVPQDWKEVLAQSTFEKSEPATLEQLEKVEKDLGVTLPEDFKDFYLHTNGADSYEHFYGLDNITDISGQISEHEGDPEMFPPEHILRRYLPLFDDGGANEYVMLIEPDFFGVIAFKEHEDHMIINPCFDSFADFVRFALTFYGSPTQEEDETVNFSDAQIEFWENPIPHQFPKNHSEQDHKKFLIARSHLLSAKDIYEFQHYLALLTAFCPIENFDELEKLLAETASIEAVLRSLPEHDYLIQYATSILESAIALRKENDHGKNIV